MYRLPTQSTSSTDIVAAPRENITFSPLAIIRGIHSALVEKSYPQKPNVCSSVLEELGERILDRVQREVTAVLLENGLDHRTDWESRVFRPVIATFYIVEELGVCKEDSEYIFLLATTLSLAFELLLLAGRDEAGRARTFLVRAFRYIFVEPEICRRVGEVLHAERARLIRMNAGMEVLRAIQGVRMLIPDTITCNAAWDAGMFHNLRGNDADYYFRQTVLKRTPPEPEVRLSKYSEEAATKFLREAEVFAPLRRLAANPFDVEIKVFLRYGTDWENNFVTSMDIDGDRATMKTAQGLRIGLEPGCSVSPVTAVPYRMSVTMPAGSINGFTGTIYIPPGCGLRVDKVEEVKKKTGDVEWTIIETAIGIFEIGKGDYHIRRLNWGSRVIIENAHRQGAELVRA